MFINIYIYNSITQLNNSRTKIFVSRVTTWRRHKRNSNLELGPKNVHSFYTRPNLKECCSAVALQFVSFNLSSKGLCLNTKLDNSPIVEVKNFKTYYSYIEITPSYVPKQHLGS